MLSRVGNSIYWMNRYIERAYNIVNFVEVNQYLLLDLGLGCNEKKWQSLINIAGSEKLFHEKYKYSTEANILEFLTFDISNPNSIISCISMARENARTSREIISSEIWNHLNELYHFLYKYKKKTRVRILDTFYSHLIKHIYTYMGIFYNTMPHNESWHFGKIGSALERADNMIRILNINKLTLQNYQDANNTCDFVECSALLKSINAYEMYCDCYHYINYKNIMDFLIFNANFPRSFKYSITESIKSCTSILHFNNYFQPSDINQKYTIICDAASQSSEQDSSFKVNMLNKTLTFLEKNNIESIINNGIHSFINELQLNLNHLDNEINLMFFTNDTIKNYSKSKIEIALTQ